MMEEAKTIESLDPRMWEYPFVYKGMTIEAYTEEKDYYGRNWKSVHDGKYMPLWKQRGENHERFDGEI